MVKVAEFKQKMEKNGYYGNEELMMDMILLTDDEVERDGISAVCLTGKPGVGKTFLPETLAKVMGYTYLAYTCVQDTRSEQLLEDINVPKTIAQDHENAVTPGILVQAINAVNRGEKVVVVLDEFDKSERQTDFYLLEYLQSGKTYTPTFGNISISQENMKNIVVFVCKNNERDIHEALMRRFSKYIEVEAPDIPTVRRILDDAVAEGDETMKEATLAVYSMILEEGDAFKKIATIQEMKNALREDIALKKWGRNEAYRMENMLKHMAKFPDDRILLDTKLQKIGLMELADGSKGSSARKTADDLRAVSIANFLIEGYSARLGELEDKVHLLIEKFNTSHMGASGTISDLASKLPTESVEEGSFEAQLTGITTLGTISDQAVKIQAAYPKKVYDREIIPMVKPSAMYGDNQYVLAEFIVNRSEKGTEEEAMFAIAKEKTKVAIDRVLHDGIVLAQNSFNKVGIVHFKENEVSRAKFYLVSDNPVVTQEQFSTAIRFLPRYFENKMLVSEMNATVLTDKKMEKIQKSLQHVYDVSKDHKEIIGETEGVMVRFEEEHGLITFKVTPSKRLKVSKVKTCSSMVGIEVKAVSKPGFNNDRTKVYSIEEAFEIFKTTFERTGSYGELETSLPSFKEIEIEGNNTRQFAKNAAGAAFGLRPYTEVESYVIAATGMKADEFRKNFIVVDHDTDDTVRVYAKKRSNGDSYWTKMNHTGTLVDEFVDRNRVLEENNELDEKAAEVNRKLLEGEQQEEK